MEEEEKGRKRSKSLFLISLSFFFARSLDDDER